MKKTKQFTEKVSGEIVVIHDESTAHILKFDTNNQIEAKNTWRSAPILLKEEAPNKQELDEIVTLHNNNTATIVNMKCKTKKIVPIWTKEQVKEYTYRVVEVKYGIEVANWFRQFAER